jgi:hypothetical protein
MPVCAGRSRGWRFDGLTVWRFRVFAVARLSHDWEQLEPEVRRPGDRPGAG